MASRSSKKIVALRAGAMGDCVVTFPCFRLLRNLYPDSEISIVGSPYSGPVFGASPDHDRLYMLHHKRNNLRYLLALAKLRRESFDLLIDFQDGGRARTQTALLGGRQRIGFNTREKLSKLLYTDVVPKDRTVHAARRLANLLAPLGISPDDEDLFPSFDLAPGYHQRAENLLSQNGVIGPFAILQVTRGKWWEYQTWPSDRYARVAEHLYERGFSVVVASVGETNELRDVIKAANCPIHNVSGETDVLVLAALMSKASIYVGYNTGPMHLAAAVGIPIVALYDVDRFVVEWAPLTQAPYRPVTAREGDGTAGWRIETIETHEVIDAVDWVVAEIRKTPLAVVSFFGEVTRPRVGSMPG